MDRDIDDGFVETRLDDTATLAFDSLELIERATGDGCSGRALQDIVGNLLVLLASLDDENGATRSPAEASDQRVRSLVVDCLVKAGVPPHAIPDALGLIRDCFDVDGPSAGIDVGEPFPGDAAD